MTKEEFKARWEKDADGDGITYDDIVQCAKEWGLCATPYAYPIDGIVSRVLKAANTSDAYDYD